MRKPSNKPKRGLAKSGRANKSSKSSGNKNLRKSSPRLSKQIIQPKSKVRKGQSQARAASENKPRNLQSGKDRKIKRLKEEMVRKGTQMPTNRNGRVNPSRTASLKQYEAAVKLLYAQEFEKAKGLLEKIIASFEEDRELVERARIHIKLCEQKIARKTPLPRSVDEHYNLAIAFFNQGRYQETFEHLRKALKHDPTCDYVLYALAVANCKTGDLETALRDLREAINLKPENRFLAQRDEDFAPLKEDSRFISMVFPDRSGSVSP
jgi:tetratricopeptide (TPR) repeat protein